MSKARIMIVEDEVIMALNLRQLLGNMGYAVVGAFASGEEAVQQATQVNPDLVLMDINLAGAMDGIAAAEQIRQNLPIPVIFLTAYSDETTLQRAKITEPLGYILKPLQERELYAAIEIALYRHKADQALKRAEEELEAQRVLQARSDRLRSLGEMAAGIAHELNQPLMGVRGTAEHMLLGLEWGWDLSTDKLRNRLQKIVEQADRMTHLIEHIRLFSREAGKPECTPVQVNEVVQAAVDMLEAQFRSHGLAIELDLGKNLPAVLANPFSLEEVLLNLLSNARDALDQSSQDGAITAPPRVLLRTSASQNADGTPQIEIQVNDTGVGIAPDINYRQSIRSVFHHQRSRQGHRFGTGRFQVHCRRLWGGHSNSVQQRRYDHNRLASRHLLDNRSRFILLPKPRIGHQPLYSSTLTT